MFKYYLRIKRVQLPCKPNAESSLFAEVQPVLARNRVQRYEDFLNFANSFEKK